MNMPQVQYVFNSCEVYLDKASSSQHNLTPALRKEMMALRERAVQARDRFSKLKVGLWQGSSTAAKAELYITTCMVIITNLQYTELA